MDYDFFAEVHVDRVRELYSLVVSHRSVISLDLASVNGDMWRFHIFGDEAVTRLFEESVGRIRDILSSARQFEEA